MSNTDTEFEYGEKRDNLKLIRIDTDDTIAEMVRKINDNFGNLAMPGGGPEGKQGIQGIDGVDGLGYSIILSSPCAFINCDENWKPSDGDETDVQLYYYETDMTKDIEIVKYNKNIDEYMKEEVLPHVPDAHYEFEEDLNAKKPIIKTGAEFPFTRYFYEYKEPEKAEDLLNEFMTIEHKLSDKIKALLEEV